MKYIIFDIDGTLLNTTKVDDECYIDAFETIFSTSIRGVKWNQLTNVTDWGITEELVSNRLERKVNPEEIIELKKLFLKHLNDAYILDKQQFNEIAGASEFYKSLLKNNDFKIGIATGGWEETANFKLDIIGIDPINVGYSNSNYFKTREEIVMNVIKQLNSNSKNQPDEIIYFGDGEWDYKTCQKLNLRFIGIDNQNNGKLRNKGALEVYNNFQRPETIIKSILK